MWTDKYQPYELSDIVGNNDQIKELHKWGKSWDQDSDVLILYGPAGVGKSSAAKALAKEMGWEITEMNASDKRTKNEVNKIAGESSETASISGSKRLIILDEADNFHGHKDRGGSKAVNELAKNATQPVILIANDFYELSRSLRNKTREIEFNRVDETEVAKHLRSICEQENITYKIDELKRIAKNANGDVRAAVNNLEKYGYNADKLHVSADVSGSKRDATENIFPMLDQILKNGSPENARKTVRNLDMTPRELFRWLEQNIYYEYKREELENGINSLSSASVWLGRVRKTQNYKFWRYANDELTAGISSARKGKHSGWTRWQPPKYRNKSRYSTDLAQKVAEIEKVDIETTRTEILPFISSIIEYCKPEDLTVNIATQYKLTKDELSEITGSGKSTNKVERIIEKSEKQRQDFSVEDDTNREKRSNENMGTVNNSSENTPDNSSNNNNEDQSGLNDFL